MAILLGRLIEDNNRHSIIQGYLNHETGLFNFEKTYLNDKNYPRRAPIHYALLQNRKDIQLYEGSFIFDKSEREVMRREGYEPNGSVSCKITFKYDGFNREMQEIMLEKIPEDFEDQKMRIILRNHLNLAGLIL